MPCASDSSDMFSPDFQSWFLLFWNSRETVQTLICEFSSPGKRPFEFGAQICHMSILEYILLHRFDGLHHQQSQKNNHVLPEEASIADRHSSLNGYKGLIIGAIHSRNMRALISSKASVTTKRIFGGVGEFLSTREAKGSEGAQCKQNKWQCRGR